jgi:hypothetical protein
MSEPAFLLLATQAGWRLAGGFAAQSSADSTENLSLSLDAAPSAVAVKVSSVLARHSHVRQPIAIGIPSSWCFSASIQTGDLPRNDRKAMLYRLEEKLPIAAEAMAAGFIVRANGATLGVCTRHEPLAALINALEAEHVAVGPIMPTALLMGQSLSESVADGRATLVIADPNLGKDSLDILGLDGGTLDHWAVVSRRPEDVQLHLDMMSISHPRAPAAGVVVHGLDARFVQSLQKNVSGQVQVNQGDLIVGAVAMAQEIAAGRLRSWIDFRHGPLAIKDRLRLHRNRVNAALAAAVLLMSCLAGVLLLRAHRYAVLEASALQQMSDAFREQFPGWEVPSNVRAIVESEHRKASAAAASSLSPNTPGKGEPSVLQTFQTVIGHLPTEGRFVIRKMSFDQSSFDLQGQVKSYEQLDGIAAAARKTGLDVGAPESRKNAEGFWDFTLHGSVATGQGTKTSDEVAKSTGGTER